MNVSIQSVGSRKPRCSVASEFYILLKACLHKATNLPCCAMLRDVARCCAMLRDVAWCCATSRLVKLKPICLLLVTWRFRTQKSLSLYVNRPLRTYKCRVS
jgi:hypothetical protein